MHVSLLVVHSMYSDTVQKHVDHRGHRIRSGRSCFKVRKAAPLHTGSLDVFLVAGWISSRRS